MSTEHYREAALGCERSAASLRVHADRLNERGEAKRSKARRLKAKAESLDRAANELRDQAKVKEQQANDYLVAARLLPKLDKRCVGCDLGYVPPGSTYNAIHTCGQTVGPLRVVGE